jgi:hypothetical protein
MIKGGTLSVERRFRVLSKPVESIKRLSDATQNQMRNVNTKNCTTPSVVITKFMPLMFAVHRGFPAVKKRVGMEIKAISKGISAVRVKNCFRGIRDAAVKTTGIRQATNKYGSLVRNRAEIIMAAIAVNFAMGFMACIKPFLSLRSSMYTRVSAPSMRALKDWETFI